MQETYELRLICLNPIKDTKTLDKNSEEHDKTNINIILLQPRTLT